MNLESWGRGREISFYFLFFIFLEEKLQSQMAKRMDVETGKKIGKLGAIYNKPYRVKGQA